MQTDGGVHYLRPRWPVAFIPIVIEGPLGVFGMGECKLARPHF